MANVPAAFVGIISVAASVFVEVGANCRLIWHCICGASVAQVVERMVSAGDPVIESVLIVIGLADVLTTKIGRPRVLPTWVFGNVAAFGEIEMLPVAPVPVIGTVIVPAASVVILSVDVNGPDVAGWNRTMTVQAVCPPCPVALNVAGQEPPAIANEIESLSVGAFSCTGPTPVLFRVTVKVRLAPTCVLWNVRLVGAGVTLAATPVPVSVRECGPPAALLTIDTEPFR
jgi:hypothetical protein